MSTPTQAARAEDPSRFGPNADDDLLLERQLCFALSVASRSVVSSYRPVLQELNLTHPQYLVMLALWERHPRTVKSLSDDLLIESATLSPMLKRLEALEYITRQRVEGNERALAVDLTTAGTDLRERALSVPGIMMRRLNLTRENVDDLNRAMRALIVATTGTEAPIEDRHTRQ